MENGTTVVLHGVTTAGIVLILTFQAMILREHKVWVRLKDWVNDLRREYCVKHGIPFVPLENGHKSD
jgi:hypothetical protein